MRERELREDKPEIFKDSERSERFRVLKREIEGVCKELTTRKSKMKEEVMALRQLLRASK